MNGLDPTSVMFRDLSQNPPKTMGELMVIIEKDCVHKDAVAERHTSNASDPTKASVTIKKKVVNVGHGHSGQNSTGQGNNNPNNKNQPPQQQQHQTWQQVRQPRQDEYVAKRTTFTESIYELLSIIGGMTFFVWPTSFLGTAGSGTWMYTFHKERGHYTTQCQPFK